MSKKISSFGFSLSIKSLEASRKNIMKTIYKDNNDVYTNKLNDIKNRLKDKISVSITAPI
jgi:hypothetical protein